MQVVEMTFSECIYMIFETGGTHLVCKHVYDNHYSKNDNAQAVCDQYTEVMQELVEMRANTDDKCEIVIDTHDTLVVMTNNEEKREVSTHVNLRDADGNTWAIDMVPWSELLGMKINNEAGYDIHKAIACILWEITFWGYSDREVTEQRKKLKQSIADIESGKEKMIPWEDVKHIFCK